MPQSPTRAKSVKGAGRGGKIIAGKAKVAPKYTKKTKQRKLSVTSTEESDDNLSDPPDSDEEDNDDEDDESDGSAPSYSPRSNDDEKEAFFADDSADEDDEVYGAVDDISDEDEELAEAELEILEEQILEQEFDLQQGIAANFLGDIDGLSAYGFDDDLDRNEFSSSSDSSDEAERHVHFEADVQHIPFAINPVSPTLEMKPLKISTEMHHPQGFSQEELETSRSEQLSADHRAFFGDPDEDSDLTDDDLPAEAHTAPSALEQNSLPTINDVTDASSPNGKKDKKSPPRRRGPMRGIFKFDGDKPWAVLDPSGKKITFCPAPNTNRHEWLERKVNEALGLASAQSSPRASFATLLDDSDRSVTSSQDNGETMFSATGANVMMAGLNGGAAVAGHNGHVTGAPEAFYAPAGSQIFGDYMIDPEDLDLDEDDIADPTGEARLNIEDMITFDDDSDDNDLPASPIFTPAELASTPINKNADSYSHLNSDNIMSFRRGTDPSSATRQRQWDFEARPPSTPLFKVPSSPISRKRKARSPPYKGDHYKGVTAVERDIVTPKRRKGFNMK
ncbi:hypothetical protein UCRPC4_g05316 [Phaeomoniella chlamydospora]|uniref:Uncharacterized protein n=1 Tax=Phaeomoniella chlamydospora TaxID=158046 RepID=A0A0G2G163_PHACM|nr:hypothetical protein UCRPC4_g05316 [Phaeomoniella chlamydospora]